MTQGSRQAAAPVLILAAALALSACGGIEAPVPDAAAYVRVREYSFQPETVTVNRGEVVRWTNEGAVYHTVVVSDTSWQSPTLPPTWWFEVRFDSAGTFDYFCSRLLPDDSTRHPETGTVIVR